MPPCPQSADARRRLLLLLLLSCSLPRVATAFVHGTSPLRCCTHHHARLNIDSGARKGAYKPKCRRRTSCRDRAAWGSSSSSGMRALQDEGVDPHDEERSSTGAADSSSKGGVSRIVGGNIEVAPPAMEHGDAFAGESSSQERARGLWGLRRKGKRRDDENKKRGGTDGEATGEEGEEGEKEKKAGVFTYDWENGSRVVWAAAKTSSVDVEEGGRRLKDYLALPPTEYSLLDPKMITRLSEETFRMDGATMNIVGTKIQPIIFVKVEVQPEQSMANIVVERVELEGSEAVRGAGGSFNVTSSTVVSCVDKEDSGQANLTILRTASEIEIELLVPNENFVPLGVLRRAGNFVMQRVVDIGVPQFTKFLKRDYARWAEGDDDRGAVALEGEALIEPGDT